MVIDAVFIKAKNKTEEEEATIVVTMLGKKARKLVDNIQSQFLSALEVQAVSIKSSLVSLTTQVLIRATNRYNRAVKGEGEGPDPTWLKRYLSQEVTAEVYKVSLNSSRSGAVWQQSHTDTDLCSLSCKAWDKRDLVWAVYSYFL